MPPPTSSRAGQPSLHFAPPDRVRKRFEYRRVRSEGRRVHTQSFVLQVAPSESGRARLGLTVSRQVGGAVRRNRIKRLVREAFRLHRDLFPSASDIVVIAKNDCGLDALCDVLREFERAQAALQAAVRRGRASPAGARR